MRGLGTGTGGTGRSDDGGPGTEPDAEDDEPAVRGNLQAAFTAVAVVVALALSASACATGGTGARDEGPARAESVGSSAYTSPELASASPTPVPDRRAAVRLVLADPEVSRQVKRELKPCVSDEYPVDVSYGDLTGGPADDIVVNVLSCGDAVGVASYVYQERDGAYKNVFRAEEPPVYAEIDRGYLVVTEQVYAKDDALSNPSSENVVSYRWRSGRFVREYSTHTDYGTLDDGQDTPAPAG
ncbi:MULTISPECIES: hypothetical protein [Streptomyces]|uniref:hypothetical protein n=1 Tax=Streptomyces TaxID=1883 RepID=UPI00338A9ED6